jgi:hypothetical protein
LKTVIRSCTTNTNIVIKKTPISIFYTIFDCLVVGNGGRSVVKTISGVTLAPNSAAYSSNGVSLATKSLTVSGSTVTLAPATQTVTIQPGQSVLQNNIRIQRGQSLLLSEPMRKKKRMN